MRRRAVWGSLVACAAWWVFQQDTQAFILVNEVLADPPTAVGDANRDGVSSSSQDEFVELVNTGRTAVALEGWTLSDAASVRHIFAPDSSIAGGAFFVVFGGGAPQGFAAWAVASRGTLSLNNAGDTVTLRNASGVLIDQLSYGAEGGRDVSLTRAPDGQGDFVAHHTVSSRPFSPGATTGGLARLALPASSPATPEPASLILLGLGVCGLTWSRRQ